MSSPPPGSGMRSFKQQELKAWQPVLTPVAVIGMLLCVFVVFLPIGIILEDASNRVLEQSFRYDDAEGCEKVTADDDYTVLPKSCTLTFNLEHNMKSPVFFYYELRNFYQNHRRFLASKSDSQLRGDGNKENIDNCDPLEKYGSDVLVPCGLSPGAYFEDRFTMIYNGDDLCPNCVNYGVGNVSAWRENWANYSQEDTWQKEGIAWESDIDEKFIHKEVSNGETRMGPRQIVSGLNLPEVDDEDFVVWMRTSALPNFRKLHRIINVDLEQDNPVVVTIHQWFPVTDFDGEKWIVLAKTEWCGGANHSLAWTYIVVACVAIGLTVTFAILLLFGSRSVKSYIDVKGGSVRWSF